LMGRDAATHLRPRKLEWLSRTGLGVGALQADALRARGEFGPSVDIALAAA
jgi:hypothetical protein